MSSFLSILAVISALSGVVLLWIILRRFFSAQVSLLTSLFIVFGTNYFRWIFFDGATAHNFLFTCFAAILLLTLNWHRDQRWIWLILILPLVIIACFIHDLSMFILLLPILYGIHDRESWLGQRERIRNNPLQYLFLLMTLTSVIVLTRFPWFVKPGTLFYYGDPEASVYPFLASNAHLILWSFKKGWLIYTPMMLLVIPGMYFLAEKGTKLFFGIFFFFLCWFLLASSHKGWATDPGFGQRFFIETYAILALPLGFFVEKILLSKNRLTKMILVFPFFFLFLNLFQTWQFTKNILIPEKMNHEAYFALLGKTHLTEETSEKMDIGFDSKEEKIPGNTKYRITRVESHGFEAPVPPGYESYYDFSYAHSGKSSWKHSKEKPYSPGMSRTIGSLQKSGEAWIRVTGWFMFVSPPDETRVILVTTCNHKGNGYKYFRKELNGTFKPMQWNYICLDYRLPEYFTDKNDLIQVYFWNNGNQICHLDDITIDLYEPVKE